MLLFLNSLAKFKITYFSFLFIFTIITQNRILISAILNQLNFEIHFDNEF